MTFRCLQSSTCLPIIDPRYRPFRSKGITSVINEGRWAYSSRGDIRRGCPTEHEGGVLGRMTYPATVLNDLENVEGTGELARCQWNGFLADIVISPGGCIYLSAPVGSRIPSRLLSRARVCVCARSYGVHTHSAAERYRCSARFRSSRLLSVVPADVPGCSPRRQNFSSGVTASETAVPVTSLSRLLTARWASGSIRADRARLTADGQG